ncbi:MAG: DUF418 domain-containing protein [Prevotella sp.]
MRAMAVAMITLLHCIEHFNLYNQVNPDSLPLQFVDQMVWDSLWFIVGGKAYAIFALLFGFSFYIMDRNAAKRGEDFRLRFCWRMLLLFCFGCLNASFFCGEILVFYSIVGLILPAVCRLKVKTLLILAAVLMLQPVEWFKMLYAAFVDSKQAILVFDVGTLWNAAMVPIAEGTFLETLKSNLWTGQLATLSWNWGAGRFLQTASLFILGYVAARQQWFADTPANRRLWGRVFAVALLCFFPLYGLSSLIPDFVSSQSPEALASSGLWLLGERPFMDSLMLIINSLHKFAFMTIIVTSLLFAFYTTCLQRPLRYIMPYGRMSLTNYITQSMIGAALFYHWGLHLAPCDTVSVLIGIAILTLQLTFCRWWIKRHTHGPFEAVWRKLTYIW